MALCYRIKYTDRFGAHEAVKWGETSNEAMKTLEKVHVLQGRVGVQYSDPVPLDPQPFTDAGREALRRFWGNHN